MLTKTLLAFALASVTSLAAAYKPGICDAPGGKTRPCITNFDMTHTWYFDDYEKYIMRYRGRPGHMTHIVLFEIRVENMNTRTIRSRQHMVFCDLHQRGEHWHMSYKVDGREVPYDMRLAVEGTVVGNYAKWGCQDLKVTDDEPIWLD